MVSVCSESLLSRVTGAVAYVAIAVEIVVVSVTAVVVAQTTCRVTLQLSSLQAAL